MRRSAGATAALCSVLLGLGVLAGVAEGKGVARDHGWQLVLAHEKTAAATTPVLKLVKRQATGQGLKALVERDGTSGYEVAISGFKTRAQVTAALAQARRGFPHASIEKPGTA